MPDSVVEQIKRKLGKYELSLGSKDLEKKVISGTVQLRLDEIAELSVELAISPGDRVKHTLDESPSKASLSIDGVKLFDGQIIRSDTLPPSRLRIVFADPLYKARKTYENTFVKEQSLQSYLQAIAGKIGLEGNCIGPFGDMVTSFHLTGKSYFDHLTELSYEFGFFFYFSAASGKLTFIRAGSHKESNEGKAAFFSQVSTTQTQSGMFRQIALEHFESATMEPKTTKLEEGSIYSVLGSFKSGPSYNTKQNWKLAQGEVETHLADFAQFSNYEIRLKHRLAKYALLQDRVSGASFLVAPAVGDCFKLSQGDAVMEGSYLVESNRLSLTSALAKSEITLVRA